MGYSCCHRGFNELHFVGRSAFNVSGDRKTRYVRDRHDLGAFAALCLADSKPPFFYRNEAAIDERFAYVNAAAFAQVFDQRYGNASKYALFNPLLKVSMAGLVRRISRRKVFPRSPLCAR